MDLIIIHGNGAAAASRKISEIKRSLGGEFSLIELNGKAASWGEAKLGLQSGSLFEPKSLVILEDFKEIKFEDIPQDGELTVVLKFTKPLISSSTVLKEGVKFKAQVFTFNEEGEASLFPYLDFLADKNPQALRELEKNLDEWGEQYVLTMIFYCLRRFIQSPKKLPPFVQQKMARQRKNFPRERIEGLYRDTIETDFKIKQGLIEPKIGMFLLTEKFLK